jgi:single-stranded-DNA-specific exonuclease
LLTPEIKIDAQINLADITPKFYRILKQFAPFGPGNMIPVFMTTHVRDTGYGKCVGEDDKHLRLTLSQPNVPNIVGIGFGLGDKYNLISDKKLVNVVYSIDENYWNGNVSLQLKLRDIKESF